MELKFGVLMRVGVLIGRNTLCFLKYSLRYNKTNFSLFKLAKIWKYNNTPLLSVRETGSLTLMVGYELTESLWLEIWQNSSKWKMCVALGDAEEISPSAW